MAEFEYQYVAKRPEQKSFYEMLQGTTEKLDAARAQMAKDNAARNKKLADDRNKQLGQLANMKTDFTGWSNQQVDEYQKAWAFLYNKAKFHDKPEEFIPMAVQIMYKYAGRGKEQAQLHIGQNSAYDSYSEMIVDPSIWKGEGIPNPTPADLETRAANFHQPVIFKGESTMIDGVPTNIGDYVEPSGGTKFEKYQARVMSDPSLQNIEIQTKTDPSTGVTVAFQINPATGEPLEEPVKISGPTWNHPDLGKKSWYLPQTYQVSMTPSQFFASTNVKNMVANLQRVVDTDEGGQRISSEEARNRLKQQLLPDYRNTKALQDAGLKLYADETFDGTKPAGMEFNQAMWDSGQAQANGWKLPEDLFLDQVVAMAGFKRNIPQGSSSSATQRPMWDDTRKDTRMGLPENIVEYRSAGSTPYKMKVYGEQADLIEGLDGQPRVDVTIPEQINLLYANEKVSRIIPFPDNGVVLVEKARANTDGEVKPAWGDDPEGAYGEDWDFAWSKKPETKYIVVPVYASDGTEHPEFTKLQSALIQEYERGGGLTQSDRPLWNLIQNFE